MQAGDDKLVSAGAAAAFADRVPNATYEEIRGAYHELLFEPDGQRHADRLLAWFDEHLTPQQ
jgi:alpha-beta hydrolase superfamily lysophospholipase